LVWHLRRHIREREKKTKEIETEATASRLVLGVEFVSGGKGGSQKEGGERANTNVNSANEPSCVFSRPASHIERKEREKKRGKGEVHCIVVLTRKQARETALVILARTSPAARTN